MLCRTQSQPLLSHCCGTKCFPASGHGAILSAPKAILARSKSTGISPMPILI